MINADFILKYVGDVKAKNRFTTNAKIAKKINNQKTQWWSTISINQDKSGLSLQNFGRSRVTAKPLAATTPPNSGENSRTERCSGLSINFVKMLFQNERVKNISLNYDLDTFLFAHAEHALIMRNLVKWPHDFFLVVA